MTQERIWLVIYVVGAFIWFGHAINRFIPEHGRGKGEEIFQALMTLLWPLCLAVYLPYRIFRWLAGHGDAR